MLRATYGDNPIAPVAGGMRALRHDLNRALAVDPLAARRAKRSRRRLRRASCALPVSDTRGHEHVPASDARAVTNLGLNPASCGT
jgi:hypothetical protein